MQEPTPREDDSPRVWWSGMRLRYNLILIVSGATSGIGVFVLWALFARRLPCLEITGFTLVIYGLAFALALCIANILYSLGLLAETVLRPTNRLHFRSRLFALGAGISVLLIFVPVIGNVIAAVRYPAGAESCENHGS
jgi:uncharacterized Tic20 family protein